MNISFKILLSLLLLSAGFSFAQNPELKIEDSQYKFEKQEEGAIVKFSYSFVNTGNSPLLFQDYKVSCNCTVVRLPKEPILPGKKGEVYVSFDTAGKIGFQKRTITLITNAGNYEVVFKGVVKATEETKKAYKESQ